MKHQVYFGIALRIILLFGVGMLFTYISPYYHEIFGDVPYTRAHLDQHNNDMVDVMYDWSATHYWYYWMLFCLFLLSLINTVASIARLLFKHYPTLFNA